MSRNAPTGKELMPVVFPGFSWANLMHSRKQDEKAIPNEIARNSGRLFWRQIEDALSSGASMLYAAMFDEVDEGTAFFKIDPSSPTSLPSIQFQSLNSDGESLQTDWYLRMAGVGTALLRERRAPIGYEEARHRLLSR